MKDMAPGEAVSVFRVPWSNDLVRQDQLRKTRRVLRECLDYRLADDFRWVSQSLFFT